MMLTISQVIERTEVLIRKSLLNFASLRSMESRVPQMVANEFGITLSQYKQIVPEATFDTIVDDVFTSLSSAERAIISPTMAG